jgi:hypothetical protein
VPIEDAANITIFISTENEHGGYAGRYISGLGDVNKDGLDDFALGAYKDDEGGDGAGQVFVFFGRNANQWPSSPTVVNASDYASASFIGESKYDNAGFSVSGEDINNDGYSDLLIGAANGQATITGKAYVIFGRENGWVMDQSLSVANLTFTGDYPYNLTGDNSVFAFEVSGIGDINSDGYADFSISAPFVDRNKGMIFVIFGNTTWIFSSPTTTTTPVWPPIILILSLALVIIFRKRTEIP